jgi:ABC-2 type transport system permease protein
VSRVVLSNLSQNPIVLKEMRGRMRGSRGLVVLTMYILGMSLLVAFVYLTYLTSNTTVRTVEEQQVFGKVIFSAVIIMEMFMVSFVAPALTAGAIAAEREHQTYDLLRTTLLPARSLVGGKFFSGLVFLLLLLLAAVPLQSLAFFFGGVALEEVVISAVILIVMAISFSAFGLFFSSFIKRTLVSTVLAYAFTIFILFGVPMLLMFGAFGFSMFGIGANSASPNLLLEVLLFAGLWLILSINPMSAAIATEVMLIENQNPWWMEIPLSGSSTPMYMLAPWITYAILYLLLSVILIAMSVYIVKRPEK